MLPLNNPSVVSPGDAGHLRPDDLVVGVLAAGRARAYPWWILANHHIANDVLILSSDPKGYLLSSETNSAGRPLAPWYETVPLLVTLCEHCAGCSAYMPVFEDAPENPLIFIFAERSSSAYSSVGTYTISDVETQSRWHPFTGRAYSGPLEGRRLKRIPAFIERWDTWRREFPKTDVAFAAEEMRTRFHVRQLPRVETDTAHTSTLVARRQAPERIDHRLDRNELVLGIGNSGGDKSIAYTLSYLKKAGGVHQFNFDGEPCLLLASGAYRGFAFSRRVNGEILDFERAPGDAFRVRDHISHSIWNFVGEATSGGFAGSRLEMIPDSYVSKWSDWSLAHPEAAIGDRVAPVEPRKDRVEDRLLQQAAAHLEPRSQQ
ncbi:MAG TPA: DUF3179 domain-containing (seleno)protein [Stellaceae bacterium]|nr:DUF3179 domain-containing (seleno)protein [Stellaceae bacterium]